MNFVDTTAYKGKRFEIKQNLLIINQVFSNKTFFFQYLDITHAYNPSVFKGFVKLEGKNSSFEKYKRLL